MISKNERKEIEKTVRTLYQDVIKVEIKEDPDDESSLFLNITRGIKLPTMLLDRKTLAIKPSRQKREEC